jgi:capsular exopolysaccharide synthesis family protein
MENILKIAEEPKRAEVPFDPLEAPLSPFVESTDRLGRQLVSLLDSESFEANQYRVLRQRLEEACGNGARGLIAVTSPGAGEGKTTTAINLAGILARSERARVLLVDADLRLPDVAAQLGVSDTELAGLSDAILDPQLPLESVVRRLPSFNLSFLPAGAHPSSPAEVLRSPRFGKLLEQARHQYDHVVLDTPPVLPVPDCRVIARWIDRFVLVVSAHRTPRKFLEESLNAIGPEKLAGLVFNNADPPRPGPYGYYAGYGSPSTS